MAGRLIPDFERLKRECESDGVAFPDSMFSRYRVSVSRDHAGRMAEIVRAVERATRIPGYREKVMGWAPEIARHDPGCSGVFFGYDFHIGDTGPRLIEINTNAGGAYLNILLLRAWGIETTLEDAFFEMFMQEWRSKRGSVPVSRIAIVDDDCKSQFLYPEFCLFRKLFQKRGIPAVIANAEDLEYREGRLFFEDLEIDLVYNRLTDFSLESHPALREAYLSDSVLITPHPRAHALFADKRNLSILSDPESLSGFGLDDETVEILVKGIAKTRIVKDENPEKLWAERKGLFFKPGSGYGAKAVYKGEKLTKRVWGEILEGSYVCQEYVPPMEVQTENGILKYDYRNFAYRGEIQLLAARLYQGQTTNFRTEGGGFAPVSVVQETMCGPDLF